MASLGEESYFIHINGPRVADNSYDIDQYVSNIKSTKEESKTMQNNFDGQLMNVIIDYKNYTEKADLVKEQFVKLFTNFTVDQLCYLRELLDFAIIEIAEEADED